jgi:hypothetical protein
MFGLTYLYPGNGNLMATKMNTFHYTNEIYCYENHCSLHIGDRISKKETSPAISRHFMPTIWAILQTYFIGPTTGHDISVGFLQNLYTTDTKLSTYELTKPESLLPCSKHLPLNPILSHLNPAPTFTP